MMSPDKREDLLNQLVDPSNRFYRYPWVEKLALACSRTKIRPNQITLVHTVIGVTGSWMVFKEHYLLAVVLFEIRNILDSLDGVLARLQKRVTPLGRTLDALASAIFFNSLMILGAIRLVQDFRHYDPLMIIFGVLIFAMTVAHCGTVYQLLRRKLGSIIRCEVDSVEQEWREQYQELKDSATKPAKFSLDRLLGHLGFSLDSIAIKFVSSEWHKKIKRRKDAADWHSRMLSESKTMNELASVTRAKEFKRAIRATAWVSDENVFTLINIILLALTLFPTHIFPFVHPLLVAFGISGIYALVSLWCAIYFLQRFLHGVHRE
jgi:phosphatidylglycerophosphate synthase